jgi:SAM-dependent methyltransferase
LLEIAGERVPAGDFRECDMSILPFEAERFDVVTGINAFQFAPNPAEAFSEAARVLGPRGRLLAAAFAEPERNEGTALHLAMKSLVAESEADGYAPYALSQPRGLEAAVRDAGLGVRATVEVPVTWRYADRDTALRALLASAGGARSVRAVGHDRVVETLKDALGPFTGADGVVTMRNLFRYVIGEQTAWAA